MSAIIFVLGFVLLIFGVWLGILTATRIEWISFIPYTVTYHPYANLARAILLSAVILMVIGGALAAYYGYKRMKLMAHLTK